MKNKTHQSLKNWHKDLVPAEIYRTTSNIKDNEPRVDYKITVYTCRDTNHNPRATFRVHSRRVDMSQPVASFRSSAFIVKKDFGDFVDAVEFIRLQKEGDKVKHDHWRSINNIPACIDCNNPIDEWTSRDHICFTCHDIRDTVKEGV